MGTDIINLMMSEPKQERLIVDPALREFDEAFQRMMKRLRSVPREAQLKEEIALGVRNPDGSPKSPVGEPYLG